MGIKDAVVVLKNPKLEGDQLTFDVDVLEGDLQGADGAAAVFIDILGLRYPPAAFTGSLNPQPHVVPITQAIPQRHSTTRSGPTE